MTEPLNANLAPRALLLESADLLFAPHAAQQLQDQDITFEAYLSLLVGDLARGLSPVEWTRKIAQEGDIQLARRLAASCDSPDLDRFIGQQQQIWLKQTQVPPSCFSKSAAARPWTACALPVTASTKARSRWKQARSASNRVACSTPPSAWPCAPTSPTQTSNGWTSTASPPSSFAKTPPPPPAPPATC
jgi:hypothetical protein